VDRRIEPLADYSFDKTTMYGSYSHMTLQIDVQINNEFFSLSLWMSLTDVQMLLSSSGVTIFLGDRQTCSIDKKLGENTSIQMGR
jgi:uncharacterized protein YabE (DUF348 family)